VEARKQVNAELVVARDRALEVSRLKSQLLANVSHELRTPLGAILGFSEMLRGGFYGPINDKQRSTINKIIATNQNLTDHVSELLDQAQLEAGRLKLINRVFEPGELLNEAANKLSILAEDKGLALVCEVDPNLPITLVGDLRRLQQILTNLIGNAIKFTDKGTVTASVYRVNENEWALAVQDTGPGIPQEAQEYIFEPFRQVDGTITRIHEGSGLGLSIVKKLVTLMNGRVTINSELGQGSLLTVILPIIVPNEEDRP
jgi:signal transduction histidine kinase